VKREINAQIYNYEEKKEEKRLEETAIAHQQAAQNPDAANQPVVENTIPFNEGGATVHVDKEAESKENDHAELVAENHPTDTHIDNKPTV